jgi:hypothetical protein
MHRVRRGNNGSRPHHQTNLDEFLTIGSMMATPSINNTFNLDTLPVRRQLEALRHHLLSNGRLSGSRGAGNSYEVPCLSKATSGQQVDSGAYC